MEITQIRYFAILKITRYLLVDTREWSRWYISYTNRERIGSTTFDDYAYRNSIGTDLKEFIPPPMDNGELKIYTSNGDYGEPFEYTAYSFRYVMPVILTETTASEYEVP